MWYAVWNAMVMEKKMMINPKIPNTTLFGSLFLDANIKRERLASGFIIPDENRCVQCGICSYNCPIGVDVRAHAFRGLEIHESKCLTCGECVRRCPRGVLQFDQKRDDKQLKG